MQKNMARVPKFFVPKNRLDVLSSPILLIANSCNLLRGGERVKWISLSSTARYIASARRVFLASAEKKCPIIESSLQYHRHRYKNSTKEFQRLRVLLFSGILRALNYGFLFVGHLSRICWRHSFSETRLSSVSSCSRRRKSSTNYLSLSLSLSHMYTHAYTYVHTLISIITHSINLKNIIVPPNRDAYIHCRVSIYTKT